jgi:methyl-accepting chemotaxis protein
MNFKKSRRKQFFIDKKFQSKFVLNVYIIIILSIILLGLLLIYFSSKEIAGSIFKKLVVIKNTKEIILPLFLRVSIIILILAFIIAGVRFILLSHKIAGPMFRFKKILEERGKGDLTLNVKFRKRDELKEVADLFTSAVKSLNKKLKIIKNNSQSISERWKIRATIKSGIYTIC